MSAEHCPTCSCPPSNGYKENGLSYGPVGNPDSDDWWERAQARVADGWHVEGQYLGYYAATTKTTKEHLRAATLNALVAETHKAGPR